MVGGASELIWDRHLPALLPYPETSHDRLPTRTGANASGRVGQVMVRGMVAWTVVFVLTLLVPLRVVTVSVTWTVTELGPVASFLLGVPDSTPAEDNFSPFGSVIFFHFNVVE